MQASIGCEEGLWVEPASAAPVAALPGLLARGEIQRNECIICIFSGAGFKDSHLAEAEATMINERQPAEFAVEEIVNQV